MPPDPAAYNKFKNDFLEKNCTACGLSKGRTHLVFDRGNPAAKILMIGEAPGAEEDKTGRSFVGRAGKVLDGVMASIGIDTDRDTLIANVVKCRPPDNRPPRADEAETCFPFLEMQIKICDPQLIVLLGRTAMKYIMPDKAKLPMKDIVGKIFTGIFFKEKKEIPCLLLYHPAYLLYDPRKRRDMLLHLETLKKIIINP